MKKYTADFDVPTLRTNHIIAQVPFVLPPPDVVPDHLQEDGRAKDDGAGKTDLPQNGVSVGRKPGREEAEHEN